jgi:3-dehydroquinate dehydratase type I
MICVSISRFEEIAVMRDREVDLVELRLDQIGKDPADIYHAIPAGWKTIATCRPGAYEESRRLEWLKASVDLGALFVDAEIESGREYLNELKDVALSGGTQVILSYHNFEETPEPTLLVRKLEQCYERGGDVAKIATHVNSTEDLHHLLSLYALPGRKVVIGMGKIGRIIRVMAPYLGAEFTFASPGEGLETAPGQLDLRQLLDIYKMIDES